MWRRGWKIWLFTSGIYGFDNGHSKCWMYWWPNRMRQSECQYTVVLNSELVELILRSSETSSFDGFLTILMELQSSSSWSDIVLDVQIHCLLTSGFLLTWAIMLKVANQMAGIEGSQSESWKWAKNRILLCKFIYIVWWSGRSLALN